MINLKKCAKSPKNFKDLPSYSLYNRFLEGKSWFTIRQKTDLPTIS
jgi:hypothetical protein